MARLNQQIQQAVLNLQASKLRSCLAILGILIGTAAIVALMNCSQLATEKALAQFRSLNTDLISLTVFQKSSERSARNKDISLSMWRRLPSHIPGIRQIAPYATVYQDISFAGNQLNGTIVGADETLASIIHIELAKGHFVSFVESFEQHCVIGDGLAKQLKLLSLDNPLKQQIRIGRSLYTIIGIAKPWTENGFFNQNINQSIIIPIGGIALLDKNATINNAIVLLKGKANIDNTIEQITQFIHHQAPQLNLFLQSAKQIIASMKNQRKIFTLLLTVIGSISLLVGGIGIMNVMLISVSERKKEIGIRKAIGAKNSDIRLLFLIESILLALIGGIIGSLIGLLFTWIIAYFNQWSFAINTVSLAMGCIVSVTTGIFFGFYPAHRAAQLQPVDCLSHA
ncbi:MAG: ABC transporter permease [Legionellaceae bacterium]|nr:ABC transporter permease [Legionellaceae bacterium]